jgi:hypothetical protein
MAEFFVRSGQLICVLEDWSPSFGGLFLYYYGKRQLPAALRAPLSQRSKRVEAKVSE